MAINNTTINNTTDNKWYSYHRNNIDYSRAIYVNGYSLNKISKVDKEMFSNFTSITELISSIKLSLLNLYNLTNVDGYLSTEKGDYNEIAASNFHSDFLYFTLKIAEKRIPYNSFLDTSTYRSISLIMPFVGTVDLNVDDFIHSDRKGDNGELLVVYMTIDIPTCTGTYFICSQEDWTDVDVKTVTRLIKTIDFDFGIEIPITMSNVGDIKRNVALNALSVAASVGLAAYTGIIVPPKVTTTVSTKTYDVYGKGISKGSRGKKIKWGTETTETTTTTPKSIDKTKPISDVINTSISVANKSFPNTSAGNITGSVSSVIGLQRHQLTFVEKRKKVVTVRDEKYRHLYGMPLGEIRKLSNIQGFTKICDLHLEADRYTYTKLSTATQYEKDLLEKTLYEGIIL